MGRHFVEAAIAKGHKVTLFHRGRSGAELFPEATHLIGDRDKSLDFPTAAEWDATVDFSAYLPRHVRELSSAVTGRSGVYVFISTTAAYAPPQRYGFTEDSPLVGLSDTSSEEVTDETYGGLKVLCERAAEELFQECVIVRPTYVVGPLDYSGRFTYWVRRIAQGGEVLSPGPADAFFSMD